VANFAVAAKALAVVAAPNVGADSAVAAVVSCAKEGYEYLEDEKYAEYG
jgi:hypothetical protein